MRRLLLFFLNFLSISMLCAQNTHLSDVHLQSENTAAQQSIDSLLNWIRQHQVSNPEINGIAVEEALTLQKQYQHKLELAEVHELLGDLYSKSPNEQKRAIKHFSNALQIQTELADTTKIALLNKKLASVYIYQYKFPLSLKHNFAALKLFQSKNNLKQVVRIYSNISTTFKKLEDFDNATIYLRKAASIIEQHNQWIEERKFLLLGMGNLHSNINQLDSALYYYNQLLPILDPEKDYNYYTMVTHNIGTAFRRKGENQKAIHYLLKAYKLKKAYSNSLGLSRSAFNIARYFYVLDSISKARNYIKEAYKYASQSNDLEVLRNSSEMLFLLNLKNGNKELAEKWYFKYSNYKDSILNISKARVIADVQEKYETEKKEQQIKQLANEKQLILEKNEKDLALKEMQRNVFILITLFILVILGLVFRSQRRNKKLNQELEEANQINQKLFQMISHDLRSPLASLADISKLIPLQIQQQKWESLQYSSSDLEQSVERLMNLTDNLLAWSLNSSVALPFHPFPLDLRTILEQNLALFRTKAAQLQIHLELQIDEPIKVFADKTMIHSVVRNLIDNALKFTPEYGLIYLGAHIQDSFAEITVKDTGIGIPDEKLASLFELQPDKSLAGPRGEKGNGLGLALCKEFVEKNKGEIRVHSQVDKGTTFTFTLPLAPVSVKTIN